MVVCLLAVLQGAAGRSAAGVTDPLGSPGDLCSPAPGIGQI